jgi:hypothetical protein
MPKSNPLQVALLALGTFAFGGQAQGGLLTWTYSAGVLASSGPDSLAVNGERLTISLTFDDASRWTSIAGWLYAPPSSIATTITGPHSVALNTTDVSAAYGDLCCAAIVESRGSRSYVDLVVDGRTTLMSGNGLAIASTPADGDIVLADHLPTSLETFSFFEYESPLGISTRYGLGKRVHRNHSSGYSGANLVRPGALGSAWHCGNALKSTGKERASP